MSVTAELVEGISGTVLSQNYENATPIPEFHRDLWRQCCSDHPHIAIGAPRGHAKSTSITHAYLIACLVSRERKYALIISDTEEQAAEFISDIKREFTDNEELRDMYMVDKLIRDQTTDTIIRFKDGHMCRIIGKGSEQKIRGRKWRGTRPDIILCHEKGTEIYADGEWMRNEDHPTAKTVETDGIAVTVEGHTERVSADHRYWVKRTEYSEPEWVFAWELKPGMLIGDEEEI